MDSTYIIIPKKKIPTQNYVVHRSFHDSAVTSYTVDIIATNKKNFGVGMMLLGFQDFTSGFQLVDFAVNPPIN